MSIATVVTEGFGSFGTANFIPTEGFGDYAPSPPAAVEIGISKAWLPYPYWLRHRRRHDPDHIAASHAEQLAAHLLGIKAPAKIAAAAAAIEASPAAMEALDTGQWERAEREATLALLEAKLTGMEMQQARLREKAERDRDEDEALALITILGNA